MPTAILAFVQEALLLAPLVEKAFSTLQPLIVHVISVLSSGYNPTPQDAQQLAILRQQAQDILDQRAADAAKVINS